MSKRLFITVFHILYKYSISHLSDAFLCIHVCQHELLNFVFIHLGSLQTRSSNRFINLLYKRYIKSKNRFHCPVPLKGNSYQQGNLFEILIKISKSYFRANCLLWASQKGLLRNFKQNTMQLEKEGTLTHRQY